MSSSISKPQCLGSVWYCTSKDAVDPRRTLFCSLSGYKIPLKKEILKQLYATHEAYVKKVKESVDTLVRERLKTQGDGLKIIKEADQAAVP